MHFLVLHVAIDCGFLPSPPNGNVELTETTFMSIAKYSCDEGFALVGNFIRVCLVNSQWSGDEPTCRFGESLDKSHSHVLYIMIPVSMPACFIIPCFLFQTVNAKCPRLPRPENGDVLVSGLAPGDVATYVCFEGYILQGDSERTCQENGVWTGSAPTCERELNLLSIVDA